MAELSTQDPTGTRYQGYTITATRYQLENVLGKPNGYTKETGNDWVCETEDGDVFTVYSWNAPYPPSLGEIVSWHIGADSGYVALTAKDEIEQLLNATA